MARCHKLPTTYSAPSPELSAYAMTHDPDRHPWTAKDYVFAKLPKNTITQHTQKAIEKINQTVGTQIRTRGCTHNIPHRVQALL